MPTGDVWRLGRRPELDAVRGVAVSLVVLAHAGIDSLEVAGVVGVTVFFTLSGFLITALLLQERDDRGQIDLRAFYVRRTRRLLPALLAMLAVVGGASVLFGRSLAWLAQEALPVVLYVGNWQRMSGDYLGWWSHTWSLAVEEQFYLLWPVAVIACARFGRLAVLTVAGAGTLYAIVARLVLWDGSEAAWTRIYYGSDTHLDGLLLGAILAAVMHGRADSPARGRSAMGLLSGLVAVSLALNLRDMVATLTIVPALTVALLFCVARGGGVAWLRWRPIVLIGQRSYGLYLWHYPLLTLFHEHVPAVLLIGLAWLLTLGSWRYVEQPFLARGLGQRARVERNRAACGDRERVQDEVGRRGAHRPVEHGVAV